VGGERAKSGHKVKVGDCLEILRDRERFVVRIERLPGRRGPAAEARACFVEEPSARAEREAARQQLRQDRLAMPRTAGRPDKHTRRLLRRRNREE
jgi:ribosome-associated heat shock protein Hsp15